MKPLKAFINKDVIKRMKHNDRDKTLYIVVPYGDEELLRTEFPDHRVESLDRYYIWILTEQELLSVIDEIKDVRTEIMFVLESISKEDLKDKINRTRYANGGFNRSITYFTLSKEDIQKHRSGIKRLYTGR